MTKAVNLTTESGLKAVDESVRLTDVTVSFGSYTAIKDVSLSLGQREFVCVVGPTGCGKSTILNTITGLLPQTKGTVEIFGEPLSGLNRRAGYMLQMDGLLPWKTALDNVALGLIFHGVPAGEARERALPWIERVGLKGFESRYPHQLSGGMKKRVALAQVLILGPSIICMDEPFSALDVHTRHLMENELLRLWQEEPRSVLFITHDLQEAIALGDRVIVMSAGPASQIVREFTIPLPRPRDVAEISLTDAFNRIHRDIWSCLRGEVEKSYVRR